MHPNTLRVCKQLKLPVEARESVDDILMAHERALAGMSRSPRVRSILAAGPVKGLTPAPVARPGSGFP